MISKEEAKEMIQLSDGCVIDDFYVKNTHNYNVIDKIYDSVGSCGECEHYTEIYNDRTTTSNTIWVCNGRMVREPDFFCADFEREGDK